MTWARKYFFTITCTLLIHDAFVNSAGSSKPHIIIILADDLGWNDVSFHGSSQIPTPNIDALAYNGLILNQHYVQALCTPSRAALMTGKYPIHTGMQHMVILEDEPWGLPLSEKILPQYLKEAGYATHALGKWHLGFFRQAYTPTARGFDTHYGYWQGLQDYFDHTVKATFRPYRGLDMRRNMKVDNETIGIYATDLYTQEAVNLIAHHNKSKPMFLYLAHLAVHSGNTYDPLQALDEEVSKFMDIPDPKRRTYAGMVSRLDQSVGNVVAALRKHGMLENSIVLFMSDNGAPSFGIHANYGSNYPLRGMKATPWDGGMRGVAAIWSPWLKHTQKVSSELFHISDWLPTLCAAAGIEINDTSLDGVNQWGTLTEGTKTQRSEILLNIDNLNDPKAYYAALRVDDLKYLTGTDNKGQADEWYGFTVNNTAKYLPKDVIHSQAGAVFNAMKTKNQVKDFQAGAYIENSTDALRLILTDEKILQIRESATVHCNYDKRGVHCNSTLSPCLFNITDDPCEQNNLAETQAELLKQLESKVEIYKATVVAPRNLPMDKRADPARWNNIWVPWYDELDKEKEKQDIRDAKPLISPTAIVYCLVILTILLGAGAIVIKQCVLHDRDDNDLPECHKVAGLNGNGLNAITNQGHNTMEQNCFDNVVCTS
uniref:Arylsulfatase B n=1 Tax=Cacopsylla melanoneura TaxID=428564 RepID=A0A8D8LMK3_9HEMI